MVTEADVEKLDNELLIHLPKSLREVGYAEPDVRKNPYGGVDFSYAGIFLHAKFYCTEGPQLKLYIEREASNGLVNKAVKRAEESGCSLEEEIKEIVRETLNASKTESQLRREKGYFQDREVNYDGNRIRVDVRVKRYPKEDREYSSLVGDFWAIFAKPFIKLGR